MMMTIVRHLYRVWQWWRELWQIHWDESTGIDSHKWESKTEFRRRLSRSHSGPGAG